MLNDTVNLHRTWAQLGETMAVLLASCGQRPGVQLHKMSVVWTGYGVTGAWRLANQQKEPNGEDLRAGAHWVGGVGGPAVFGYFIGY